MLAINFIIDAVALLIILNTVGLVLVQDVVKLQRSIQWYQDGVAVINSNKVKAPVVKKAKNVILLVGDGMGPTTVTAARILEGQIKGKLGVVGVNENVTHGDCSSSIGKEVLSIAAYAESAGLSTGIVTTTSLTDATPSAAYANVADRSWQYKTPDDKCEDIASQLIAFKYGDGFEVALGGGRDYFLPASETSGLRVDGRNLINEWKLKSSETERYKYISTAEQLRRMNADQVDHVLGIFSKKHFDYSKKRSSNESTQPSLVEMLEFAVNVLQKNEKGYFLLVEGGTIDLAHHVNKAYHALHDTVEFSKAVQKAKEITYPMDTLLIATADHAHAFTMSGYQSRGHPIFGLTNDDEQVALDGKRFLTLSYMSGPSAQVNKPRRDVSADDLSNPDYQYPAFVPLLYDHHGGEDVGVYARGRQAHLIRGVIEQNYIFHVMNYALCLTEDAKELCKEDGLLRATSSTKLFSLLYTLHLKVAITFTLINLKFSF